jgi:hypothetical protein
MALLPIVRAVLCALTLMSPPAPAVKVVPSMLTAEPPIEAVCVVDESGMIQAPFASCVAMMALLPIVMTVFCALTLTRPLVPAVKVVPPISTAEPPIDAVCVVETSGTIQAPLRSCVHCSTVLPTVMIVVCTLMRVAPPPPELGWSAPDWPGLLLEPELSSDPWLFPEPEPSWDPWLLPVLEWEDWLFWLFATSEPSSPDPDPDP